MKVVGGSASVPLARGIARELAVDLVDVAFEKHPGGFPDGERYVRLLGPVSGEHVVLVQTTHPSPMVVELFLLADAIRNAGACRITPAVPTRCGQKVHAKGKPIRARSAVRASGRQCFSGATTRSATTIRCGIITTEKVHPPSPPVRPRQQSVGCASRPEALPL